MTIERKRAIPRLAITTLALGGPSLLASCDGSSGNPVRDYCTTGVACYSGSSADVNDCIGYYNDAINSYASSSCRAAFRNMMACGAANFSCTQFYNNYYANYWFEDHAGCDAEYASFISSCF